MPLLFWFDLAALGLTALISTSLILVALGTAPRQKANQAFALVTLMHMGWAVVSILLRLSLWVERVLPAATTPLNSLHWLEVAALFAYLMSVFSLNFVAHYLGRYTRGIQLATAVGIGLGIPLAFPLFQHQTVSDPQINRIGGFVERVGPWGIVGGTIAVIYVAWGYLLLYRHRRQTDPFMRWGLLTLLFGLLIGGGTKLPFPFTMSAINLIGFSLLGYGIIHRQVLNPLKTLILERERAQAQAARRTENLIAINRLAIRCTAALPEDELYRLATEELREITQTIGVVASAYDARRRQLVIRSIATQGGLLARANELLGKELIGLTMPVEPGTLAEMLDQEIHVEEDLSAISFGAIPPLLAQLIKSALGIDRLTAVVLKNQGQLLGTLSMVSTAGSPPIDLDVVRTFAGVVSTALQRARAEAAWRESEEWYRTIFDYAADGLMRIDNTGMIGDVNLRMVEIIGPQARELIGRPITACTHLVSHQALQEAIKYFEGRQSQPAPYEMLITCPDGRTVTIEVNARPILRDGQVGGMIIAVRDISERKKAEEELQRRNAELLMLNQAARAFSSSLELDEVLITVLEHVRTTLNVFGCSIWLFETPTGGLVCRQSVGLKSEVVRGWRLAPGQGVAGWVAENRQSVILPDTQSDQRYFKEIEIETGIETRSLLAVPLQIKERIIGVLELVDLNTARFSQADLALAEALALTAATAIENARLYEQARQDARIREELLHEVNHRVRNNLAAILGILKLETERPRDEHLDYHTTVRDLIARVRGLADVHNILSKALWSPLPLDRLIHQIVSSALSSSPLQQHIQFTLSCEDGTSGLSISPRQAPGLAIALNELTTNSVKYAFQGRTDGRIDVHLGIEAETWVRLTFRDDGPGWPQDVLAGQRESVGLRLIRMMVRSPLNGQLELTNDGGAVATIRFHPAPPNPSLPISDNGP